MRKQLLAINNILRSDTQKKLIDMFDIEFQYKSFCHKVFGLIIDFCLKCIFALNTNYIESERQTYSRGRG